MKIKRKDLLEALQKVRPATGQTIQQSDSFAFADGLVVSYNDEIGMTHPVEGLGEDFSAVLHAEECIKVLSKLKPEEIDVELTDIELRIKAKRVTAGLALQGEITLPLDSMTSTKRWKKLPEQFNRLADFARQVCSPNRNDPILNTVHVTEKGILEATDRFRLVVCDLGEAFPFKGDYLITANSIKEITKLKPNKVSSTAGWLHFKNEEGTTISCRTFTDEFMNLTEHIKAEGDKMEFPELMKDSIEKAAIFAMGESNYEQMLTIDLSKNKLKVGGRSEMGWIEEAFRVDYSGDKVKFKIAPYLLLGILKETRQCEVTESSLKFVGDGWTYLTVFTTE